MKCNLPVTQLPTLMCQQLMHERKYIHQFCELCTSLCQMGLLSFGKREWKQKDQARRGPHTASSALHAGRSPGLQFIVLYFIVLFFLPCSLPAHVASVCYIIFYYITLFLFSYHVLSFLFYTSLFSIAPNLSH